MNGRDNNRIRIYHQIKLINTRNKMSIKISLSSKTIASIGIIGLVGCIIYALSEVLFFTIDITQFYPNDFVEQHKSVKVYKTGNIDSFKELNDSLFCPLISESDKSKYSKPLNDIYNLQFTENDTINYNERKYYILKYFNGWGLFSQILCDNLAFSMSIGTKRTFLYYFDNDENYKWLPKTNGKSMPICQERTGRDCIFKPFSSFDNDQISQILENGKKNNEIFYLTDKICKKLYDKNEIKTLSDFENLTKDYKIILQTGKYDCKLFMYNQYNFNNEMLKNVYPEWNINYHEFNALLFSYSLAINNNIKNIIYQQIYDILYVQNNWLSNKNTLSLPIRGSDHCGRDGMKCGHHEIKKYQNLIEEIIGNNSDINYIIITSESDKLISKMTNSLKNNDKTNKINIIYNNYDAKQGTGNPKEMHYKSDMDQLNILLSMLTTLKLQMHSNYVIIKKSSNWLSGIWLITDNMDCQINKNLLLTSDLNKNKNEKKCIDIEDDIDRKQCYRFNLADTEENNTSKPKISVCVLIIIILLFTIY